MSKKEHSFKENSKRTKRRNINTEKREKPISTSETVKKLWPLLKPHSGWLILSVAVTAAATLLTVVGPDLLGQVIDALKAQVDIKLSGGELSFEVLATIIGKLAFVYFVASICFFIQSFVMAGVTQRIIRDLRERINHKLSKLPLRYYDNNVSGEILSRITNDVDNLSNTLQNNITQLFSGLLTVIGVLIMMLSASWQMTLIVIATVPPSLFIVTYVAKKSKRYFSRQWTKTGELNGHIEEIYNGHKIVHVFSYQKEVLDDFDDINNELQHTSFRAQFISGLISPILTLINNIGYLLICVIGGLLATTAGSGVTIGSILTFITYSSMFTSPITSIGNVMNNIQSALASAERVFALLEEKEVPPDSVLANINGLKEKITFSDVTFGYLPNREVIRDMNINIKRGQVIAIVGPTGAGKTTIVNLLMRFYDVDTGKITIDGIDIRDLARSNLRKTFGMVLQDTWLFKGSVRDNILYSNPKATEEDMIAAAKQARADHFIQTYADGYDFILEENASNISQGQSQLITIARAILANPDVLILDEATSSVDTRTEILIQNALNDFMKGKTSFVIAHRLSTILNADLILVMNEGKVIEHGTHQDLLQQNGFYTELYRSQFVMPA